MARIFYSFRGRMIQLFVASMVLSGIIAFLLFKTLQYYYHVNHIQSGHIAVTIRQALRSVGDFNIFFILFLLLSFLLFFLLTKPYSRYFKDISNGIDKLAKGEFDHKVHIRSKDEFAAIAKDINMASDMLKEAIQRGDFSEQTKDQLVVNLAHDLRTPLTSVIGYLDLVMRDDSLTAAQVNHYVKIAFTKSQHLEKLIDQLFEMTRLNYGMLHLQKEAIVLTNLLNQLSEELYPLLEENNLQARINSDGPLQIVADGALLARVLENIMMNAIRYGGDGQYIDVNGFALGNDIVIQIINYGNVIEADQLMHIFDMFYTGDKARTKQEGSSGLGLFIAKNIIEQHSGTISATSDMKGTIFEIRLPKDAELANQ